MWFRGSILQPKLDQGVRPRKGFEVVRNEGMYSRQSKDHLAKRPASRAVCQAKRAPRAAFPSGCLAAQTKRWAEGCRRPGFHPRVGKIPWRRERLPTPVFWPGEFSPWGHKELDMTECPCLESFLCCWKRLLGMTSAFSWQKSGSLCSASFCTRGDRPLVELCM